MKKSVFLPLLAVVLMAAVLFGLTFGLKGVAAAMAQKEHLKMMQTLLPGSEAFTVEAYTGEDENIRRIHKGDNGFVIEAATQGYADEIRMLIGVSNDGKVKGLVVRDLHETRGLGNKALTDWVYLSQYLNTQGDAQVGENVDASTGATVTSKAITRCINSAVAFVTGADADSGATSWGG